MSVRSGWWKLPLLAAVTGALVTFAGVGLLQLIALITNVAFHGRFTFDHLPPDFSHRGPAGILIPAAGGLIIGLIARYGSEAIRGHGIPEAMQGVMTGQSRIPLKVALLKPFSTALSIGTGGPFGAEGPIIATGGAVGSLLGQWLPHSAAERKVLLAAGAAAGMTAVFGTPFAGVLLAVELLLFEFKGRSLVPVAIAAATAMALRGLFHEPLPMLPMPALAKPNPADTCGAAVVGIAAGFAGVILTRSLHRIEEGFARLPLHWMWHPALGGLAVGLIGWIDPRTLGTGYFNLRALLDGNLPLLALTTLAAFKFLSWVICLGSGTAGGTLAPVMTVGGAVGALSAHALHAVPGMAGFPVGLGALVGMAAVFSSISRAMLASVAFAFEATHSPTAFGPLLLGCAVAVLVSRLAMKESIMTEGLARKGIRVPQDYEPDPLEAAAVGQVMHRDPLTVPPDLPVAELARRMTGDEPPWNQARFWPIVGGENVLLGVIARADVLAALREMPDARVLEAGVAAPVVVHPDDTLAQAADHMVIHGVGRLPVIEKDSRRLLGWIGRREILLVRRSRIEAEQREGRR